ncbi:unnamed protein product, partial [Prorocentrum cordatum]
EPFDQCWTSIKKNGVDTVATGARACRFRLTRKQENKPPMHGATFAVGQSHLSLEPALIKFFLKIGGVRKFGAAPKGALERDAQKLLDKLEGK